MSPAERDAGPEPGMRGRDILTVWRQALWQGTVMPDSGRSGRKGAGLAERGNAARIRRTWRVVPGPRGCGRQG